ncbi:MAG TPA: hypothetical protein VMG11_12960 [Steroidobacteraceae bacterium]|nr:hypothetical protein [Steroidobacteraceae bacterium]
MSSRPPTALDDRSRLTLRVVVVFGLLMVVFVGRLLAQNPLTSRLTCEHASGLCTIAQVLRRSTQHWVVPLRNIKGAEIPPRHGGRPSTSYTVSLRVANRDYYFTSYNSRSTALGVIARINAFLKDPSAPPLVIEHDERTLNSIAWILMILVSIALLGMGAWTFRRGRTGSS